MTTRGRGVRAPRRPGPDHGSTPGSGAPAGGASRPGPAALRDRLTGLIAPVTGAAGFDLERLSVSRVGRRHRVQVVVDRDEGVGLDAIADISRAVAAAIDAAEGAGGEVVPGEYVLEVSSPGVDRLLVEPRHWRRNVGRLVSVPITDPAAGAGPLTGRVVATDPAGVTLEVAGATRTLAYRQLGPGRVQVELRRLEAAADLDDAEGDAEMAGADAEPDREGGA